MSKDMNEKCNFARISIVEICAAVFLKNNFSHLEKKKNIKYQFLHKHCQLYLKALLIDRKKTGPSRSIMHFPPFECKVGVRHENVNHT